MNTSLCNYMKNLSFAYTLYAYDVFTDYTDGSSATSKFFNFDSSTLGIIASDTTDALKITRLKTWLANRYNSTSLNPFMIQYALATPTSTTRRLTPVTVQSGASELVISNGVNAPIERLAIDGATTQVETTLGKNLFDGVLEVGGINADGTLNPISTSKRSAKYIKVNPLTTYTLSQAVLLWQVLICYDINFLKIGSISAGQSTLSSVFTTLENTAYIKFFADYTGRGEPYNVQFELGNTATAYTPFVPNSPSPLYPSTLTSVGQSGSFNVISVGKNLFDKTLTSNIMIGYPSTTILLSSSTRTIFIKCKPLTTYTVSKILSARFGVFETEALPVLGSPVLNYKSYSGNASITTTTTSTSQYLGVYLYNTILDTIITLQQILDSVQIELGSQSTVYESFKGVTTNISKTLRSLPDGTKDRIVIDKASQTAWVERKVGRYIINGTENLSTAETSSSYNGILSTNRFIINNFITLGDNYVQTSLCDRLKHLPQLWMNDIEGYSRNSNQFHIRINNSTLGIVNGIDTPEQRTTKLKTWLASNNIEYIAPLKTPTIEYLTYPNIATIQYLTSISKDGVVSNMSADVLVLGN